MCSYHQHASEGRWLGHRANTGGAVECLVSTARGRAVCGRTACTVLRGEAGNGARPLRDSKRPEGTRAEAHRHRASLLPYLLVDPAAAFSLVSVDGGNGLTWRSGYRRRVLVGPAAPCTMRSAQTRGRSRGRSRATGVDTTPRWRNSTPRSSR